MSVCIFVGVPLKEVLTVKAEYFTSIKYNPDTGEPYEYKKCNTKYVLNEKEYSYYWQAGSDLGLEIKEQIFGLSVDRIHYGPRAVNMEKVNEYKYFIIKRFAEFGKEVEPKLFVIAEESDDT